MDEFATLLKAARHLDKDALATIFDQYSPVLYKFVSRLIHDPVLSDQIVADVFVRLVEELSIGKGPRTSIRSYLYRIAYRLVVERFRERHPHSPLQVAVRLQEKDNPQPQTKMDERGMMEALISTLNSELSEDQRIVIILRFLEEFSLKETAEIIGKDVNNVKVIQTRGIAKLKKAMGIQIDAE
jgi:RNA polymerase sigma-70 factor, ECF subfamily